MTDLNDLVTPDYDGHLVFANDINDAGGSGANDRSDTGDAVAFVATPVSGTAHAS